MLKALVADDEQSVLSILQAFLTKLGFEVVTACCADDAFQHFYADTFDLVVLDIQMPEMDGFQTAKEMRITRPNQKIIMITGLDAGQVYQHLAGTTCDFDDILYKPFTFEKITEVIGQVMKN